VLAALLKSSSMSFPVSFLNFSLKTGSEKPSSTPISSGFKKGYDRGSTYIKRARIIVVTETSYIIAVIDIIGTPSQNVRL